MLMHPVFIYALNCPLSGQTRYIGKAKNPKRRLQNHLADTKKSRRTSWIKSLTAVGLKPVLEVLAQVPESDWRQWEIDYIAAFRSLGFSLVNGTDGGEGFEAGEKHPFFGKPSHNLGKTPWIKGKHHSSETRALLSRVGLGKKLSAETILKRTATCRLRNNCGAGLRLGDKHPMFGKKQSPETIAKRAAALTGKIPWNKGMKNGKRSVN